MSVQQVLDTVEGALADPIIGLATKVQALANDDARIRSDFAHIKWTLAGKMTDARSPNIMVRPRKWSTYGNLKVLGQRDADALIDIGYENFSADPEIIQDNIAIVATALAQVVDELRDYSDAHAGTIIEVKDTIDFDFGQFEGPTSSGFLATITLTERSFQ